MLIRDIFFVLMLLAAAVVLLSGLHALGI